MFKTQDAPILFIHETSRPCWHSFYKLGTNSLNFYDKLRHACMSFKRDLKLYLKILLVKEKYASQLNDSGGCVASQITAVRKLFSEIQVICVENSSTCS